MLTTIQLRLLSGLAVFAVGFGAAEVYEHRAPWGLGPRLARLRDSLPARDAGRYSAGAEAQRAIDEAVVRNRWQPALVRCNAERERLSAQGATVLDAERDAATRSSAAAYRLGRSSCTGAQTDAQSTPSSPPPVPRGMRGTETDLRSVVASSLGSPR